MPARKTSASKTPSKRKRDEDSDEDTTSSDEVEDSQCDLLPAFVECFICKSKGSALLLSKLRRTVETVYKIEIKPKDPRLGRLINRRYNIKKLLVGQERTMAKDNTLPQIYRTEKKENSQQDTKYVGIGLRKVPTDWLKKGHTMQKTCEKVMTALGDHRNCDMGRIYDSLKDDTIDDRKTQKITSAMSTIPILSPGNSTETTAVWYVEGLWKAITVRTVAKTATFVCQREVPTGSTLPSGTYTASVQLPEYAKTDGHKVHQHSIALWCAEVALAPRAPDETAGNALEGIEAEYAALFGALPPAEEHSTPSEAADGTMVTVTPDDVHTL